MRVAARTATDVTALSRYSAQPTHERPLDT